jgi:hypothetical protein
LLIVSEVEGGRGPNGRGREGDGCGELHGGWNWFGLEMRNNCCCCFSCRLRREEHIFIAGVEQTTPDRRTPAPHGKRRGFGAVQPSSFPATVEPEEFAARCCRWLQAAATLPCSRGWEPRGRDEGSQKGRGPKVLFPCNPESRRGSEPTFLNENNSQGIIEAISAQTRGQTLSPRLLYCVLTTDAEARRHSRVCCEQCINSGFDAVRGMQRAPVLIRRVLFKRETVPEKLESGPACPTNRRLFGCPVYRSPGQPCRPAAFPFCRAESIHPGVGPPF